MKWPSDFPHMTRGNGPILIGYEGIGGWFAYKGSQWFSVKKRKDGEPLEADRDVELVTDPAILAKLGPAEALVADERPRSLTASGRAAMSHLSKLDLKIIDQILSEGNIWWGADEIIERLASAGFLIVRDDGRDIRSCKQGAADG